MHFFGTIKLDFLLCLSSLANNNSNFLLLNYNASFNFLPKHY